MDSPSYVIDEFIKYNQQFENNYRNASYEYKLGRTEAVLKAIVIYDSSLVANIDDYLATASDIKTIRVFEK